MHQSRLILTEPTFADEAAVLAFRERFTGHNSAGEIPGGAGLQTAESYSEWLSTVRQYGSAKTVPLGRVQASTYLAKPQENGKVIGIIQIRHALTPHLLQVGGHIGYSVSPDERRKGYGTQMLQLALEKCREIGLTRVLVTCDKANIASAAVIQTNGGILENEIAFDGVPKQRYWIAL